jgi:outer membrane autotransporter protein
LDNVRFAKVGVASGDDNRKIGVWLSGLYGINKKAKSNSDNGYNGRVVGPTIGKDYDINEDNLIGVAYSYVLGNIKYNKSHGEKIESKNHVLSLYNQSMLSDDLLWNNIFSLSAGNVTKKNAHQISPGVYRIATGNYNTKAFSFESILSYKFGLNNNMMIMPNIGIRAVHYANSSYKEKGAGVQNLHVGYGSGKSFAGIIGAKFMMEHKLSEDILITPSLKFSVENNFINKDTKIKSKFIWMNDYFQSEASEEKPVKLAYNIGAGIMAQHKNTELLLSYNCHLHKKYQSHQGYLRVKLSF